MTVFDTARAEAIAVLMEVATAHRARSWGNSDCSCGFTMEPRANTGNWHEHVVTEQIQALLAARSSTTCETCGGHKPRWQCSGCREKFDGELLDVCPSCERRGYWTGSVVPCPSCSGSGTVPGGPLLLDLVAEQVGVQDHDGFLHELRNSRDGVPVYRAREST